MRRYQLKTESATFNPPVSEVELTRQVVVEFVESRETAKAAEEIHGVKKVNLLNRVRNGLRVKETDVPGAHVNIVQAVSNPGLVRLEAGSRGGLAVLGWRLGFTSPG